MKDFNELIEILGAETILIEVQKYFSSDEIEDFCKSVSKDYDLCEEEEE